jgi:hypothetical protein
MQHTQSSKLFGAINGLPIDLTFGSDVESFASERKALSTLLMYFKVPEAAFSSVK